MKTLRARQAEAQKKIRAADAKEVGVGNPAEETYCYPNVKSVFGFEFLSTGYPLIVLFRFHSGTEWFAPGRRRRSRFFVTQPQFAPRASDRTDSRPTRQYCPTGVCAVVSIRRNRLRRRGVLALQTVVRLHRMGLARVR